MALPLVPIGVGLAALLTVGGLMKLLSALIAPAAVVASFVVFAFVYNRFRSEVDVFKEWQNEIISATAGVFFAVLVYRYATDILIGAGVTVVGVGVLALVAVAVFGIGNVIQAVMRLAGVVHSIAGKQQ